MIIGVVGLGLIGASLAKALKAKTNHTVLGFDNLYKDYNTHKAKFTTSGIL